MQIGFLYIYNAKNIKIWPVKKAYTFANFKKISDILKKVTRRNKSCFYETINQSKIAHPHLGKLALLGDKTLLQHLQLVLHTVQLLGLPCCLPAGGRGGGHHPGRLQGVVVQACGGVQGYAFHTHSGAHHSRTCERGEGQRETEVMGAPRRRVTVLRPGYTGGYGLTREAGGETRLNLLHESPSRLGHSDSMLLTLIYIIFSTE